MQISVRILPLASITCGSSLPPWGVKCAHFSTVLPTSAQPLVSIVTTGDEPGCGGGEFTGVAAKENAMKAWQWIAAGMSACALVVSCGGSDDDNDNDDSSHYTVRNLVSDTGGTPNIDPNLVNPWGIAFNPKGAVWVPPTRLGVNPVRRQRRAAILVVSIPDGPAGEAGRQASSSAARRLRRHAGRQDRARSVHLRQRRPAPSPHGRRRSISPTPITVSMTAGRGKAYTGSPWPRWAPTGGLYAADFHNRARRRVQRELRARHLDRRFIDPNLPAGYAPFGIQAIEDRIYRQPTRSRMQPPTTARGAGLGY